MRLKLEKLSQAIVHLSKLANQRTSLPGQAMFLDAETPHAYLRGTGLEVMENSENVLRAALTNKYINVPKLWKNISFECMAEKDLFTRPQKMGNRLVYPVPVDDFSFFHFRC